MYFSHHSKGIGGKEDRTLPENNSQARESSNDQMAKLEILMKKVMMYAYLYLLPRLFDDLKKDEINYRNYKLEGRFHRQMILSQTKEEIQQSKTSAFTSVRMQNECCPRVLFE